MTANCDRFSWRNWWRIDLEFRTKAGEQGRLEDYLARFPELAEDASLVQSLAAVKQRLHPPLPAKDGNSTSVTLLQRLRRAEDHLAWSRFVDIYTPLLYRWARRSGLADQDANDLLQEVFVVLLKKLPEFTYDPQKGSFRGWLRAIALNKFRETAQTPARDSGRVESATPRPSRGRRLQCVGCRISAAPGPAGDGRHGAGF